MSSTQKAAFEELEIDDRLVVINGFTASGKTMSAVCVLVCAVNNTSSERKQCILTMSETNIAVDSLAQEFHQFITNPKEPDQGRQYLSIRLLPLEAKMNAVKARMIPKQNKVNFLADDTLFAKFLGEVEANLYRHGQNAEAARVQGDKRETTKIKALNLTLEQAMWRELNNSAGDGGDTDTKRLLILLRRIQDQPKLEVKEKTVLKNLLWRLCLLTISKADVVVCTIAMAIRPRLPNFWESNRGRQSPANTIHQNPLEFQVSQRLLSYHQRIRLHYYSGKLRNGNGKKKKPIEFKSCNAFINDTLNVATKDNFVMFHMESRHTVQKVGTSRTNQFHQITALDLIKKLNLAVDTNKFGVDKARFNIEYLSPYKAQVHEMGILIKTLRDTRVNASTFKTAQYIGRNVVIADFTGSNRLTNFSDDTRDSLVSLSRHKHALFVICNSRSTSPDSYAENAIKAIQLKSVERNIYSLVEFASELGILIEIRTPEVGK
ncbi:hypothetical protein BCON_0105g00040 [Botryotinia convoluta]|uniref:DNA2/NAM7 helicase-like C-terminal domain-containing protein n=1 Tax=Botryotinia convoluta TaxID=54673 RepID=A0A4Z1I172_9HELO|nr:hypothetical protein BCON_0105g00040 [Botryotinia convoluta]